jgi:hypothetical protein
MELPPQNVTVLDGKDATITCRAVGAPTPNITWIYQGMACLHRLLQIKLNSDLYFLLLFMLLLLFLLLLLHENSPVI